MTCPRCFHERESLDSLSRRDNATYICNVCGNEEAFIDCGIIPADEVEKCFLIDIMLKKTEGI